MFGYDCVCVGSAPTGTHIELEREQEQGLRLEELLVDPPLNGDHNSIWAVDWRRRLGQFSGAFEYSNGISWPLFVAL